MIAFYFGRDFGAKAFTVKELVEVANGLGAGLCVGPPLVDHLLESIEIGIIHGFLTYLLEAPSEA